MINETPSTFNPGRKAVRTLVFGSAIFAALVIVYLLAWGEPDNVIHTEANDWAWITILSCGAGFGLGAVGELAVSLWRARMGK